MKKICTAAIFAAVAFAGTLSAQEVSKTQRVAIQSDEVSQFKTAFAKADYDKCMNVKELSVTMLSYSIKYHRNKIAKFLLANNADINKSCDGMTPLMTAAKYGNTEMVKALLNKGADKTRKNADGKTAKELAVEMKETSAAAAL